MKQKNGFTLIELLVVIAILATLFAIMMPNFQGMRERARDAQKIQDLYSIKNALRMFYNDTQSYPPDKITLIQDVGTSNYLPSLQNGGINFDFNYVVTPDRDGFVLVVPLEAGAGDEDINSQIKCGIGATDKYFAVCGN